MKNIITNLYNGNYSLAKTYWIFGLIGSFIVRMIIIIPLAMYSPPTLALKIVTYILIFPCLGYLYVVVVGLIRSAKKYQGPKVWKYLAYVSMAYHIVILVLFQILISVYETTLS